MESEWEMIKILAGCIYREPKSDSVYDEAMHESFRAAKR